MALRTPFSPTRLVPVTINGVDVSFRCVEPSALTVHRVTTSAVAMQQQSDVGGLIQLQADYLAGHVVEIKDIDDGEPRDPATYLAWPAQILAAVFQAATSAGLPTPQKAAGTEPSHGS